MNQMTRRTTRRRRRRRRKEEEDDGEVGTREVRHSEWWHAKCHCGS